MKTQIKSALTSAILMAFLAILGYVVTIGSIWKIDFRVLVDTGFISLATGLISLIKSFLTTDTGHFAGLVKVKE